MPEIELTSETTATGIWALNDIVIWPERGATRRLRPLPRDLREARRCLADHVVEAHPTARRLRGAGGALMPVAVVTGGASGFGLALGESCAALGMDVALLDLDGERAAAEAARVAAKRTTSTRSAWSPTLPRPPAWRPRPPPSRSASASPTSCVSNVGVQLFGAVESFTDDEWRWLLDVNVTGSATRRRGPSSRLLRRSERPTARVHDVVVDPRPRQPARRLPGEQVRGVGPGGDPPARARRRRHRRLGDLPLGDDHPPPRDQRSGATRTTCAGRSRTTATSTP